ncbi:MAG: SURF1 family protein [Pseudomonadota bacterium]
MMFRPYPILTLAIAPVLALLVALGFWQLDRMGWKREALDAFELARAEGALTLGEALCSDRPADGARAEAPVLREGAPTLRVYGRDAANAPGWRIFAPADAPACVRASTVLVETGFSPLNSEAFIPLQTGLRYETPTRPGPFTPGPDASGEAFYAFDRAGMAARLNLTEEELFAGLWLARDNGEPPAHLAQTPPERHFGYAVTWFAMTLALIAVYLAFHAARGRLRFRR